MALVPHRCNRSGSFDRHNCTPRHHVVWDGSHANDEKITVNNTSVTGQALDLHLFQYSDFDIGDAPGGQTVRLLSPNTVQQTGMGQTASETVAPTPTGAELAMFPAILNSLNDSGPTTLVNGATTVGPGDVTWAFQWDVTMDPNSTFVIEKTKSVGLSGTVPDGGATMALLSGALMLLATLRKVSR